METEEKRAVQFYNFLGRGYVVLYFYPKDDTYGCIAESCAFRDNYEDFTKAGAVVVGISSDTPESHLRFQNKYNLPFPLLADTENKVRKLYGVPPLLGVLPGRTTYLINNEGVVEYIFSSQFKYDSHVKNTLDIIKKKGDL